MLLALRRIIPIFRSLMNLQGAPAHQFDNEPSVAIVDKWGALWVTTTNGPGGQGVSQTTNWSVFNTPAAVTQATATQASAGAGKRNVATNIAFTVNAVAAQGVLTAVIRDGASGVGTILWSLILGPFAVGTSGAFSFDVTIVGSAATAMTIEFTGAPAATNFESVAMTGYIAG